MANLWIFPVFFYELLPYDDIFRLCKYVKPKKNLLWTKKPFQSTIISLAFPFEMLYLPLAIKVVSTTMTQTDLKLLKRWFSSLKSFVIPLNRSFHKMFTTFSHHTILYWQRCSCLMWRPVLCHRFNVFFLVKFHSNKLSVMFSAGDNFPRVPTRISARFSVEDESLHFYTWRFDMS